MENSAYVPNPLPPPALVVFSQAGGLPEALRMQRPFNSQATDAKDLHIPFSATGFGLRHMDGYPSLPAHLLHHLQPQFLHPALDPRVPFGSGAFRPLGSAVSPEVKTFSAFSPPSKCLKIETSNSNHHESALATSNHLSTLFSPGAAVEDRAYLNGQSQQRADSSSPASVSISPPPLPPVVKEESSDVPMSEEREGTPGSEGTERSTPEEGRGFRHGAGWEAARPRHQLAGMKMWHWQFPVLGPYPIFPRTWKKKFQVDPSCCPVCGVTVRPGELEAHYVHELDRLYKLSALGKTGSHRRLYAKVPRPTPGVLARVPGVEGTSDGRYDTYQRIKANRQSRLRIKNKKRKADEATCPVCNERVQGSVEELNGHVELCLQKHGGGGGGGDEEENVDVEGESFEEYEWAGQRRVRASSMLLGGFAGAGLATCSSRQVDDDTDADLVVDGDDSATYGPPQYSEADVVIPSADGPREAQERDALREAVISPDGRGGTPHPDCSAGVEVKEEPGVRDPQPPDSSVVEALKSRIRDLEHDVAAADKFKCLICMERYKKPVISVCCWHVHCEECWLHTLGAKKLCPQCNMITSPTDLRRIYM